MTYRLLADSATGGTLPGGVEDVRGWPVRDDAGGLLGAVADAVFGDGAEAATAASARRAGGDFVRALSDPNALGATRSSDPDVGAERLDGGNA